MFVPTTQLSRNAELFSSEINEDLVMMDEKQGLYFCLNEVGKAIWQLLDKPASYAELIRSLTQAYQVDRQQCQTDVELFLQQMIKHQLVQVQ